MKKNILKATISLALSGLIATSMACDIHGKSGFLPENNLKIATSVSSAMTKKKLQVIISRVSDIYTPVVKLKGGNLEIINLWDDERVNALAEQKDGKWKVTVYGGYARHRDVTEDSLLLTICHELGHHIGGAPKVRKDYENRDIFWSSAEGQADYFGAMKCMRRILENDNNQEIVSRMKIDPEATNKCQQVYKSANDVALCQRISMAAFTLASLASNGNLAFNTPDKKVVYYRNDGHPAAQCRLDTYFNGILCDKSYDQDTDPKDPTVGVCLKRDGYEIGSRPLCWYKPIDSEI
jgi:hypothetical protein